MFKEDLKELICPKCKNEDLVFSYGFELVDDEIENGTILCNSCGKSYKILNGIPRFVDKEVLENPSWNFKWTQIDKGQCLNYKILDKSDPAYQIHDIFDRNSHCGKAFRYATDKRVIDIGCGVGQYSLKIASEHNPSKIVSLDLTGGGADSKRIYKSTPSRGI